jgi:uncharacterized repeat protein (TIGR03803 family)
MAKLRTSAPDIFRSLLERTMPATRNRRKSVWMIFLVVCLSFTTTQAQTFTSLLSFDGTDGSAPQSPLVLGANGNFYGTTPLGGSGGCGTVFEINASGELIALYNFNCDIASGPYAGLIRARNGNFFGVTSYGGTNGRGTVFEITPQGELTRLYNFCSKSNCIDGSIPYNAALMQATNGNFYGTTSAGGANNKGTVFEITPKGELTVLYSFCSETNCDDGSTPFTGLVQASNGKLYGATSEDGANGVGTIFEISPKGEFATLYTFCAQPSCVDGAVPYTQLMQATNGKLYGTTFVGGTYNLGTVLRSPWRAS